MGNEKKDQNLTKKEQNDQEQETQEILSAYLRSLRNKGEE